MKASGLVITLNEASVIARCLESLSWMDEIVLVDGGSTDGTLEIVRDPKRSWAGKVKVVESTWQGFRAQRELALSSASFDWVLVVDSDEVCSPELSERIKTFLSQSSQPRYFKVRRQEFFLGQKIYYGVWNPSYQDRFFHRAGVHYINEIHEYPKFPAAPGRIEEPLLHHPDFSPAKFLSKMVKYTALEAKNRFDAGQRTHLIHLLGAGPAMFLKNYFYYRAYRDGYAGLIISLLEGVSRVVRHVYLWELARREKKALT